MTDLGFDVLVIGAGPAGLSASLALGRARKKVLLCDVGKRRNAAAEHMHGFVSRDGIAPTEFRRIAREQLRPYDVTLVDTGVLRVEPAADGDFVVTFQGGSRVSCRRVLLATGLVDQLPDLPGVRELWGRHVFTCPYCHGWEVQGRRWGILLSAETLVDYAIFLTGWTHDVVALTDGRFEPSTDARRALERAGVGLETRCIRRLVTGPDRTLTGLELQDGAIIARDVMVIRPPQQQVKLVEQLGLQTDAAGFLRVDEHGRTSMPGVYAAGDLASPMQAAILAAAAGTRTAYALNHHLTVERALSDNSRRPLTPRSVAKSA